MDPSLIYTVDVERLSQLAHELPRAAIRLATLFDGKRKLWEVLRDSFLTSRMTVSVFGRLRELELVRVLPEVIEATPEIKVEVAPEPPKEQSLEAAPEPVIQAAPQPVIQAAPEPVAPFVLEAYEMADTLVTAPPTLELVEAPDTVVTAPPTAASHDDFDDTDHAFFDSYEPEDSSVDTFWDLEENPRKQRAARALQQRLSRPGKGGWLASLLLS